MEKQKRIAVLNDISCFGRCALSIEQPVLSACGLETCPMPTALLSTHLGFKDPFYQDLTDSLPDIWTHLKSLKIGFDAILTGFLGSEKQIEIILDIFNDLKDQDCLFIVDPTMGDHGNFYHCPIFTSSFLKRMGTLCEKAHIIIPNITELCLLSGTNYEEGPYSKEYIHQLLLHSKHLALDYIVLTGVSFDQSEIGCAIYHKKHGTITYHLNNRYEGRYVGTGDVFAATFSGALLKGLAIEKAGALASYFTGYCINKSNTINTDNVLGVNFEQCLGELIKQLTTS